MDIRVLTSEEFSREVAQSGNSGLMQPGECYFFADFQTPSNEILAEFTSLMIIIDLKNAGKFYWSPEDIKQVESFCKNAKFPLKPDPLYDPKFDSPEQAYMLEDFLFRCGLNSEIYDLQISIKNGYWNQDRVRQGQLTYTIDKELNLGA